MIVGGIPYYISFSENPHCANVTFLIEQYYETDEMKLWFLKQNGHLMSDPEAIEYSRSNSLYWTMHWYVKMAQMSATKYDILLWLEIA